MLLGPVEKVLLRFQEHHISSNVWNGEERMIRPRHRFVMGPRPDPRVEGLIKEASFGHIISLGQVSINHHLIMALVERWRPETHTFHFPYGEATVTLQDVALQLGLQIGGEAVTGVTKDEWNPLCMQLLGAIPSKEDLRGGLLKLTWLEKQFSQLPKNSTVEVIAQYARAYIMRMIGGILLPDTSGSCVHMKYLPLLRDLSAVDQHSWESAVLACLFRGLDRATNLKQVEIGGCLFLLQAWAWDRIPCVAPKMGFITDEEVEEGLGFPLARRWSRPLSATDIPGHAVNMIRGTFDRIKMNEFIWTPYDAHSIRRLFNYEVPMVSRSVVPLICFEIVEWHPVDRVMRKFGLRQPIPCDPPNLDKVHNISLRGKIDVPWPKFLSKWINSWDDRHNPNRLIVGVEQDEEEMGMIPENSQYMDWYRSRTRRYISREGALSGGVYSLLYMMRCEIHSPATYFNPLATLHKIEILCDNMLTSLQNIYATPLSSEYDEPPPSQQYVTVPVSPPPKTQQEPRSPQGDGFCGYIPQRSFSKPFCLGEGSSSDIGSPHVTPAAASHGSPMRDWHCRILVAEHDGQNNKGKGNGGDIGQKSTEPQARRSRKGRILYSRVQQP